MKPTLLFIVALISAGSLHAQPGRFGDQRPSERIEHLRKVRLIEMLDLSEEQSVRFLARLKDHEQARRDLMKQKMDVLDRIERLVRNKAAAKEYQELFPEVAVVDRTLVEQEQKFFSSLDDLLTMEQKAKYLLFQRHFEKELREAMREVQRRRMRGDPQ
jgi:hypothetical protein